jgi:hypothetical protein
VQATDAATFCEFPFEYADPAATVGLSA